MNSLKAIQFWWVTLNSQEWESQILQDLNFRLWQKNQVIAMSPSTWL